MTTLDVDLRDLVKAVERIADHLESQNEALTNTLDEVRRELVALNLGLMSGSLNIRTHHPLCSAPPAGDYSIVQLEAMAKFVSHAIETGALVLPRKEGGAS